MGAILCSSHRVVVNAIITKKLRIIPAKDMPGHNKKSVARGKLIRGGIANGVLSAQKFSTQRYLALSELFHEFARFQYWFLKARRSPA
jgi:hypothetical protein